MSSIYTGSRIILTTKHHKALAATPYFFNQLGAHIVSCQLDTDQLDTFSGEIERPYNALKCARQKCLLGWEDKSILFKGIQSYVELESAFETALQHSSDNMVWIETDMRAHVNPSRMAVIGRAISYPMPAM